MAAITALAAMLRLAGLGAQDYWGDELCSIVVTKFPLAGSIAYYATDPHPPLFYMSVRLLRQLGEQEWLLRLIPAFWGTLAVALLYLAVRKLHGSRPAAVAGAVLALNPLHVWVSQDLRSLSMLSALGALSVLLLLPVLSGERRRLRWSHVLVTAAALYTNYFALFLLAFEAACLLRSKGRAGLKHALVPALLFSPWLFFMALQMINGQSWRSFYPLKEMLLKTWLAWSINGFPWRPATLFNLLEPVLAHMPGRFGLVQLALTAPALLLALLGMAGRNAAGRRLFTAYLLIPAALVLAVSLFVPLYSEKYMVFVAPAYAACVGLGFEWVRQRSRGLALLALALALLVGALSIRQFRADPLYSKPPWRTTFAQLAPYLGPDDLLLLYNKDSAPDILYYYECRAPVAQVLTVRNQLVVDRRPKFLGKHLETLIRGRRTVWQADYMAYLHDPDRLVESILSQLLARRESVPVQPAMGMFMIRYVNPALGPERTGVHVQ